MKKFLSILFVWGWFFAFQSDYQGSDAGAKVLTIAGPFKTEASCKAELEKNKEFFDNFGIVYKATPCTYKSET